MEVSPDLISTVTDGVIDEVRAWQSRPLDMDNRLHDSSDTLGKSKNKAVNNPSTASKCLYKFLTLQRLFYAQTVCCMKEESCFRNRSY